MPPSLRISVSISLALRLSNVSTRRPASDTILSMPHAAGCYAPVMWRWVELCMFFGAVWWIDVRAPGLVDFERRRDICEQIVAEAKRRSSENSLVIQGVTTYSARSVDG